MSDDVTMPIQGVEDDVPILAVTDEGLGNTSWVLADGGDAVVVDPERDPTPYQLAAERLGAQITLAAETHLHADFVTGSRELAAAGARVAAAAAGEVAWPHEPMNDGDEIDLGRWRLRVLATPGHTPEHHRELVRQCLNIGYEQLAGTIDIDTWIAAGRTTTSSPLLGAAQLEGHQVLDVRQVAEYRAGHVPQAAHRELGALRAHTGRLGDGPTVAMCGHGERAATAASVLEAAGRPGVAILDGGPDDWAANTGEPLEQGR
jgi:rhodanese-related sulfurtransferase